MKRKALFLFIYIWCMLAYGQSSQTWEAYLDQLITTEEIESANADEWHDALSELAAAPINLNQATREDLERLPFLSLQQINDLMEYLYKVEAIRSWGELTVAGVFDAPIVRLMQYFTYLGDPQTAKGRFSLKNAWRYGKHDLNAYVKVPTYERQGDKEGYLGYPYKHWLRYTFSQGQNIKLGLVASQDAGEPFFSGKNSWGYDYYSFYLQLKGIGRLKSLVVGRYRLRLGEGLIMNTSYSFGKLSSLDALGRSADVLTGHSSRSEANYLQGIAATVAATRNLDVTLFASIRHIDATLNSDSASIATLLKTGYHRTQSEIDRKHNASQSLAGASVAYRLGAFRLGLAGLYTSLNRELRPNTETLYRRHAAAGKNFWNMAANYGYAAGAFSIGGETAIGNGGAAATINHASVNVGQRLSLMAVQRFYSYRYHALYGRSFGENSSVNNESGIYFGAKWHFARYLQLTAYTDYAYFAWPRYQTLFASHSWDNLVGLDYQNGGISWRIRYRLKLREKDNDEKTSLTDYATHRLQAQFVVDKGAITAKTQASATYCNADGGSFGWIVGEYVGYTHRWLQVYANVAYFHTKDYASRVYAYERGMRYTLSFPSYFGEGMRYALTASAAIGKHVAIAIKAGTTNYFDRDSISSGLQQIMHSSQTDLEAQLRLQI